MRPSRVGFQPSDNEVQSAEGTVWPPITQKRLNRGRLADEPKRTLAGGEPKRLLGLGCYVERTCTIWRFRVLVIRIVPLDETFTRYNNDVLLTFQRIGSILPGVGWRADIFRNPPEVAASAGFVVAGHSSRNLSRGIAPLSRSFCNPGPHLRIEPNNSLLGEMHLLRKAT
jgi:hypothetical protein